MPHYGKSWYMIKKRNWIQNSYVHIRCKITPRWGLSIMHTQTNRSCKRWRCVPTCSNTPYDWGFVKIAHFRNPTHNLGYFQIWHEKWWSPVSEICKREHQLKSSSIKKNQGPACSQGETWSPSQNPPVRKAHHQIMKSFKSNLLNVRNDASKRLKY